MEFKYKNAGYGRLSLSKTCTQVKQSQEELNTTDRAANSGMCTAVPNSQGREIQPAFASSQNDH